LRLVARSPENGIVLPAEKAAHLSTGMLVIGVQSPLAGRFAANCTPPALLGELGIISAHQGESESFRPGVTCGGADRAFLCHH
jgi:hypothetical protein